MKPGTISLDFMLLLTGIKRIRKCMGYLCCGVFKMSHIIILGVEQMDEIVTAVRALIRFPAY